VIFRDAVWSDVPAVVALVTSAYRGEASRAGWTTEADLLDGQRTDVEAVEAVITSPIARVLLGFDAGALLACCQLERLAGGDAYFGMFAVTPTAQGGGVGSALLAEAERVAREDWGAATMQMTVIAQRQELIDWYLRRGYAETGETRPFPYGDERFGAPKRDDLVFTVLVKDLS
jgi:ribosomal protein S18 acetylase RimI-like enzyme